MSRGISTRRFAPPVPQRKTPDYVQILVDVPGFVFDLNSGGTCGIITIVQKPTITEQIVDFVTSKISPERIVLFGSHARGSATENSDIDILVVMKNLENERKITRLLYKALLKEDIATPIDFIAIDYDKYNSLKTRTGYVYKTIEAEGKILYGG